MGVITNIIKWFQPCQHEWTKWEYHSTDKKRLCQPGDSTYYVNGHEFVVYTVYWQERRCNLCGKIQQDELEY
jgi:hypothetical protein